MPSDVRPGVGDVNRILHRDEEFMRKDGARGGRIEKSREWRHKNAYQRPDLGPVKASPGNNHHENGRAPSNMTAQASEVPVPSHELVFYPAYCHSVSPTWFTWVKLTAIDIHKTLQVRDGYQHTFQVGYRPERNASTVLFFLNHPIQFVQVVGMVVNLESYFERFWLFTIDDSSGATVDVICDKSTAKPETIAESLAPDGPNAQNRDDLEDSHEEKELVLLDKQVAVDVRVGTVVQVKGTVTLFRRNNAVAVRETVNRIARTSHESATRPPSTRDIDRPIRQINLARLQIVPSTAVELSLVDARTKFYNSVLSKPWILSPEKVQKLRCKALGEVEQIRKKTEKRASKRTQRADEEERDTASIQMEYEKHEKLRLREAEIAKNAGEEFTQRKKSKIQTTSSGIHRKLVELDEKTALLKAAFG